MREANGFVIIRDVIRSKQRCGQALLEYVLALAGLLVVGAILWGLVGVTFQYSDRAENLVSSDYP